MNLASEVPMSFLPAGMQTTAKPTQRARPSFTQTEVKIRRPIAENIKHCSQLQPAQYLSRFNYICIVDLCSILKVFAEFISKS